ncbi:hypothetical protein NIES4101_28280 (plasmid) [Calothrix sp. NIES-4101]|nr:hypothetical protein NIES4101_28280 [Calothrix sp. NIES-4101]
MAVERQRVLLGFQVQRQKYARGTDGKLTKSGGTQAVRGNVVLLIPKIVCDRFEIPEYQPASPTGNLINVVERRAHQRAIYSGVDDTTPTLIDIDKTFAIAGSRKDRIFGKSVAIPYGVRTPKGNERKFHIAFPSYFNLIMISQALGSMIKSTDTTGTNQRPIYFYSKSGARNFIEYNTATAPLTIGDKVLNCGAWLLTTPQAEQNTADPGDAISSGTSEGISKGGKKASA